MRPPFLQLGGEDKFAEYQAEFDMLLPDGLADVLGNRVMFSRDRCHHVCYKSEERNNKGPRDQWRQDRAERIPFIKYTLEEPNFIYVNAQDWAYLAEIKQDAANNLSPELFVVIATPDSITQKEPGEVRFRTGYRISGEEWGNFKKNQICVYSAVPPKPLKPKKHKK